MLQQLSSSRPGYDLSVFKDYPTHRRLKARKVRHATRRHGVWLDVWRADEFSFTEFNSSVKGWINHVRHADAWGPRRVVSRRLAARLRRAADQ